jgi:DNA (cytosine-5)-methyltransferase 1
MTPLLNTELIIDLFAGAGGASEGIYQATGRHPDVAINHDEDAVAVHLRNHPTTEHRCESVWTAEPRAVCAGRPVGLLWASPDCRHFSRAAGGRPKWKQVRSLPGIVLTWATRVRPRVILVENVREMLGWGPLLQDGTPCPDRIGRSFNQWVGRLRGLGYQVQWRELCAADYGAPTIRTRLVVQARCDGVPIVWPTPTHSRHPSLFAPQRWRPAADCIDWSIPCPSIFTRKRPLKDATMKRIAQGIQRFVLGVADPFIIDRSLAPPVSILRGTSVAQPANDPLGTVTAGGRHHALIAAHLAPITHTGENRGSALTDPVPTITCAHRGEQALVTAVLAGCGGRAGQSPPRPVTAPMGTMTTKADQVLAVAFLAQHNGDAIARDAREPMATITTQGTQIQLVEATLSDEDRVGAERVAAFLIHYFSSGKQGQDLREPLGAVTTHDRYALVTVAGVVRPIVDIGMRMLTWRELARAQSFDDSYDLTDGGRLTKTKAIHLIGNSVCPLFAKAIVAAAFGITQKMPETTAA